MVDLDRGPTTSLMWIARLIQVAGRGGSRRWLPRPSAWPLWVGEAEAAAGLAAVDRGQRRDRSAGDEAALGGQLDDEVQMWAMRSLGELKDRESLEPLVDRLEDDDWGIKANAARALGEIVDQRATGPLVSQLNDPRRTVRLSVIKALVSLRDPSGLAALEEAAASAGRVRGRP